MKNRFAKRVLLVCMGLLLGLALAEVSLRVHARIASRRVPTKQYVDAPDSTGAIRMAVLGGSTSNGDPYSSVNGSIPGGRFNLLSITGVLLGKRYSRPAANIDNYAGPNWSAQTTVEHYFERPGVKPDVLLLYSGQNETTRYYSPNMVSPPALLAPLANMKFGSLLLRRLFTRQVAPADQRYTGKFFSENAIPAYERRHNLWRYRFYVERLIRHAEAEGILLVIVIPQSNYLSPPTRSVYRGPAERRGEALRLFKQAWLARHVENESDRALELLEKVNEFCSFADLSYELGEINYVRGDFEAALPHLRLARNTDGFPTCITQSYRDVLHELVEEYAVPHIDMDDLIRDKLRSPVPDYEVFLDDCHIYPRVYLELSRAIIGVMSQNGFPQLVSGAENLDITSDEWAEHVGVTPKTMAKALFWEAQYCVGQGDYSFLKLRSLEQAAIYLRRTSELDSTRELSGVPKALEFVQNAVRDESARITAWARSDQDTSLGAPSTGKQLRLDFKDEVDIHVSQGDALLAHGEVKLAVGHYQAALAIDPDCVRARVNLGVALYNLQEFEEAAEQFELALILEPHHLSAHRALGETLLALNRFDDAALHMREAVRMSPGNEKMLRDYCVVASSLAWELSTDADPTKRDGARAVMLAEEVRRITGSTSFDALDTLAAAYAEAGRFEDAVATATKAIELATELSNERAGVIALRLKEYRAGRAWREK